MVSVKEAAKRLNCHTTTVQRMIRRGELHGHKLTQAKTSPYRIYLADLEEYIKANRT